MVKARLSITVGLLLAGSLLCGPLRPVHAGLFSISPTKERSIGENAARDIESHSKVVTGPVADWVNSVGQRLAAVSDPEFKYSFVVIDGDEVNAFTLPSGYIYVYTGLRKVAQTDDELAAVLAHEITHAEKHHFAHQYASVQKRGFGLSILSMAIGLPNLAQEALSVIDFAVTQKYSRQDEKEADKLGMQRMARAGFDPHGMVSLMNNLAKEETRGDIIDRWLGDHPEAASRAAAAQQQLTEMNATQPAK